MRRNLPQLGIAYATGQSQTDQQNFGRSNPPIGGDDDRLPEPPRNSPIYDLPGYGSVEPPVEKAGRAFQGPLILEKARLHELAFLAIYGLGGDNNFHPIPRNLGWGNYPACRFSSDITLSKTPLMKAPESSEPNFFPISTASFIATLGGISLQ